MDEIDTRRPMMPSPPTWRSRSRANLACVVLVYPESWLGGLGSVKRLNCVQFADGMIKSPVELCMEPYSVKLSTIKVGMHSITHKIVSISPL